MPPRRSIFIGLLGLALPAVILASNRLPREVAVPERMKPEPAAEAEKARPAPAADWSVNPAALGHSGKIRVLLGRTGEALAAVSVDGSCDAYRWREIHTGREEPVRCAVGAVVTPGVAGTYALDGPGADLPTVLAMRPRNEKLEGHLGPYHIGQYRPRPARYSKAYEPPAGFIEVTEANQDLKVSDHFRLRHFLTKDQFDVWPKYLVLDMRLIDKLELVLDELRAMGHEAPGFFVMSGYRTPQYNGPGGNGRSGFSRHIYGDAADVWLDASGSGRMDDLNGDGRVDRRDGMVIRDAVDRVEARHPELVGGVGLYGWRGQRGPFVHIDARGRRARW